MSSPFVGEIEIFGFNFAPVGWAQCQGQLMPISQNTALFSLLGTQFGGDGKSTFGLPNLQGQIPVGQGQGPGLSPYVIGETAGSETVTLTLAEMPGHTHTLPVDAGDGRAPAPSPTTVLGATGRGAADVYADSATPGATMTVTSVGPGGGSQGHNNMMPYLTLNYCISLRGIFPARS
ncbi:phage tail protein [Granulicella mallensis]|jgi:microcystin-dependent protein|uniref:Microcystin-dependent protein n=1 Tax=Granulicella mallensis TaxID=940614 RepID=A0A7W7ZTW9_9BACT|nr:tail fiber protein [Granulicella mallensis]MBB5066006.1 microcystin-dependent protein [Granulicella mallensis]